MFKWILCVCIFFNFASSAFANCDCAALAENIMQCESSDIQLKRFTNEIPHSGQESQTDSSNSFHICDCAHIYLITDSMASNSVQIGKNIFHIHEKYPVFLKVNQRIERPPIHFNT